MSDVGRYRRLYANEWHDPGFRRLNDSARVVRIYVSAGPQTTSVGCFRLSTAVAVEDLGGTAEAFEQRLDAVCEAFDWYWDSLARVIWITNWFDLNPPASPNVVSSWAKLIKNVPDCAVKTQAITSLNTSLKNLPASFREPWTDLMRTLSKPESRSETNQGSGIREFRSGSQGAGALRADVAANGNGHGAQDEPSSQLVALAREALSLTDPNRSDEELLDDLRAVNTGTGKNLGFTKSGAIAALTIARLERRRVQA